MSTHTTQYDGTAAGWWTPQRVRAAGLAAIAGGTLLFAYFTITTVLELLGFLTLHGTDPVDGVGTSWYYASEGSLLIAWTLVFVGFAALHVRLSGEGGRLLRAGTLLAAIGSGMAAVGFLFATAAPAVGAIGIVTPANIGIGLGLMVGINLGTFLMGIALLRASIVSRPFAALLIAVLPATLLAGPVGFALGIGLIASMIAILPLCAAIVLVGHYLRTETPEIVPPTAASA